MPPLCQALGIDLNELFAGERLSAANYREKAEENMIRLLKDSEAARANIVGGSTLGQAREIQPGAEEVHRTNEAFWSTMGSEALGVTALPS
jgi:hypothetical protein